MGSRQLTSRWELLSHGRHDVFLLYGNTYRAAILHAANMCAYYNTALLSGCYSMRLGAQLGAQPSGAVCKA